MSQYKSVANKAIVLIVSKILATSINIVLFVLLSYYFSTETYGSFRQLWLLSKVLILQVCSLGIPLSIFYFLPRLSADKQKAFILQSFILLSVLGVGLSLGVFYFAGKIAEIINNPGLTQVLRIFSLYSAFTMPTLALEGVLISLKRTKSFAVYTIAEKALLLIMASVSVFIFGTLEALCIVLVIFSFGRLLAVIFYLFMIVNNTEGEWIAFDFGEQIKFSLPIGFSSIVGILNVELDKIIVTFYFTVEEFAKYVNGAFQVPLLAPVLSSLGSVLMPEFSRKQKESDFHGIARLWHGSVCRVALLFIPLMVFFFVFAEEVITLLFSENYRDSAPIFRIYLISILGHLTPMGPILVSLGRSKEPLYGSLVALISNLVLSLTFIKFLGLYGPAWASVLTAFLLLGFFLTRIKAVLKISFARIFPWVFLLKTLLVCCVFGLLSHVLANFLYDNRLVRLVVCGLVFFVSVGLTLESLGLISSGDKEYIKSLIFRLSPRRKSG